jgi:hypothetical protein
VNRRPGQKTREEAFERIATATATTTGLPSPATAAPAVIIIIVIVVTKQTPTKVCRCTKGVMTCPHVLEPRGIIAVHRIAAIGGFRATLPVLYGNQPNPLRMFDSSRKTA